jgi:hypothetical protein
MDERSTSTGDGNMIQNIWGMAYMDLKRDLFDVKLGNIVEI